MHKEKLYFECLYHRFWEQFKKHFNLYKATRLIDNKNRPGEFVKISKARYTLEKDYDYRSLIMAIMQVLEPIKIARGTKLYSELDEFTEILYVMKGVYEVGYSVNNNETYVMMKDKGTIGDYNLTFH